MVVTIIIIISCSVIFKLIKIFSLCTNLTIYVAIEIINSIIIKNPPENNLFLIIELNKFTCIIAFFFIIINAIIHNNATLVGIANKIL